MRIRGAATCLLVCLALCIHCERVAFSQETPPPVKCEPTGEDSLGPFYRPGAPVRSAVGSGYVLSGTVRSSEDCTEIANARIEAWLAGPSGEYGDEFRATLFSDFLGHYRFESNPPLPYMGRPPHIHLRVSAGGYAILVTQHYPREGQSAASLDLVLRPMH